MTEKQSLPKDFSLSALMEKYVKHQAEAHRQGLAVTDSGAEVLPYDAGPVQVAEPRIAWADAQAVFATEVNFDPAPEWANLVTALEPGLAVPFCAGNFPQIVRNFLPVLRGEELRPEPLSLTKSLATGELERWAVSSTDEDWPKPLLAVGVLRLSQLHDQAEQLLDHLKRSVPAEWQADWDNEETALLWHRGEHQKAFDQWRSQESSPAVLFNRGMSALFLDRPQDARTDLSEAVKAIPESSAWHHLAQLYLALAVTRG